MFFFVGELVFFCKGWWMGVEVLLNIILFRKLMVDFVEIIWKVWLSWKYSFLVVVWLFTVRIIR